MKRGTLARGISIAGQSFTDFLDLYIVLLCVSATEAALAWTFMLRNDSLRAFVLALINNT